MPGYGGFDDYDRDEPAVYAEDVLDGYELAEYRRQVAVRPTPMVLRASGCPAFSRDHERVDAEGYEW